MWYKWLIFGVIFLLIPIGIANLKIMAEKKIKPTEEQKKNANYTCFLLMLFYWLCDFFYMAFILDSLTLKFIFGGLIMIVIFMNLSKAFISGKPQLKWGLVQDFIVGVGMSVYLIYIIPNADLQNVVIPIVSAVYGGLITLVGVAWTIRKADNDRKADEITRATPYLQIENIKKDNSCSKLIRVGNYESVQKIMFISNVGSELCLLKYICVDGKYYPISNGYIVKNETIRFDVNIVFKEISSLIVSDRFSNHYEFEFKLISNERYLDSIGLPKQIHINSIKVEKI